MSDSNELVNRKLKCLVVDDEQPAQWVLSNFINQTGSLELIACVYDGIEAVKIMNEHEIDLLFLDINLPGMGGLEMLNTLDTQPMIIFTTAFSSYAINSFDYNVVDYLVKPISRELFDRAVKRALDRIKSGEENNEDEHLDKTRLIEVNTGGDFEYVEAGMIMYIQSYGNYVKVFTTNRMILGTSTTHKMFSTLPKTLFLRIHKSYIVNKDFIGSYNNSAIMVEKEKLPIGISYRQSVISRLEMLNREK
ncbi:MAG: response regulator transcription factor [Bacteroidota bacterium]